MAGLVRRTGGTRALPLLKVPPIKLGILAPAIELSDQPWWQLSIEQIASHAPIALVRRPAPHQDRDSRYIRRLMPRAGGSTWGQRDLHERSSNCFSAPRYVTT